MFYGAIITQSGDFVAEAFQLPGGSVTLGESNLLEGLEMVSTISSASPPGPLATFATAGWYV